MKRILIIVTLCLLGSIISFSQQKSAATTAKAKIEVYYFHSENRCATCISIEENTKKALETYFNKEMKDGTIKFIIIDISNAKYKAIVDKYKVYGSSLYITRIANGKEKMTDMTNYAFSNSRSNPEKFKAEIKKKITENLK